MITRTTGFFIIGDQQYFPDPDHPTLCVSYRDDTVVQEFATQELLMAAHREQFPEEYTD